MNNEAKSFRITILVINEKNRFAFIFVIYTDAKSFFITVLMINEGNEILIIILLINRFS